MGLYLYETTNLVNGRRYIGTHVSDDIHDDYLGSGTALKAAIEKYGRENFKKRVFGWAANSESLNALEALFVTDKEVEDRRYYNMTPGGGRPPVLAGDKSPMKRPEIIAKVLATKAPYASEIGRKSNATRKKNGNHRVTDEQKRAISETNKRKGIKPPLVRDESFRTTQEYKKKMSDAANKRWAKVQGAQSMTLIANS